MTLTNHGVDRIRIYLPMRILGTAFFTLFLLVSCGGATQTTKTTPLPIPKEHQSGSDNKSIVQKKPPRKAIIPRAEFEKAMADGPQQFISKLQLKPYLQGSQFIGFQLAKVFWNDDNQAKHLIHEGDVVIRVNGIKIERPKEFMHAWSVVKNAATIEFTILRNGKIQNIIYVVQ